MKNILLFLLNLLVAVQTIAQQTRQISGVVRSADGQALVGATISYDGGGTTTDVNGRYQLSLPQNVEKIKYSSVGFKTQEVELTNQTKYDITLREESQDLEQVVVTATRTPKALKDVPVLTRLITQDDIAKVDATNVQDLLQQELPGLEFSYSMNQQTSLNMSGFGGNSVLFLVDGERMAGETLDNIDYSRLNMTGVGRIEIVKGAASTLYGSNAVGGVINLISAESDRNWALNVNSRYGKHDEWRNGLSLTLGRNKFSSRTDVQHTSIGEVKLSDNEESSLQRIYANHTWNVKEKLTFRPTSDLKLTARAGFFFRERNSAQTSHDRYRDYSAGLRGLWTISTDADLELAYSFDQYDKSDYSTVSHKDVRDYSNVQHIVRSVFNHRYGKNTLTIGADYMRDYLLSYQFASGDSTHKQHTTDAFAQFDYLPTDRINLLAGIRYDHFSAADQNSLTGKLSAMYKWDKTSLRLGYAGGFRAPTLKEMYMSFDMASIFMIYGNENLNSERSHNFSLTAEHNNRTTHATHNLTATGYMNFVSNRITTAWNTELMGMAYVNMSRLRVSGFDACYMMKMTNGLGVRLSYAFVHEHIEKGEPETSSTRPHTLVARIDYDRQPTTKYGFCVTLGGRFLSPVMVDEYTSVSDYTTTASAEYPGYTIWKLTLSQRIMNWLKINFAADNIFNYQPDVYYSNSPSTSGTTCSFGVSIDVDRIFDK